MVWPLATWPSGPRFTWRTGVQRCVFFLVVIAVVQGCFPGRGGGRRRAPRKLTPLVFKQHVPNVFENTLMASGLSEGRITRNDPRFRDLVPNYNPDIVYRDEEGTGADRLMTERCGEKVNALAISVMNQWPGVRLRVTESWDEDYTHSETSLHYEGRALDVTTSDRDRSKNGMLARLAVEVGFDWVYYESLSHIHCSCKSESARVSRLGGCFSSNTWVETPTGILRMSSLKKGDLVKVVAPSGKVTFSPVVMFLHRDPDALVRFLHLTTSAGHTLQVTSSHLVFVVRREIIDQAPQQELLQKAEPVFTGSIRGGDYLMVVSEGDNVTVERVVKVRPVLEDGVYAPLTLQGTVVVNSIVSSCYAVIDSQSLAHWAFLPMRVIYASQQAILLALQGITDGSFAFGPLSWLAVPPVSNTTASQPPSSSSTDFMVVNRTNSGLTDKNSSSFDEVAYLKTHTFSKKFSMSRTNEISKSASEAAHPVVFHEKLQQITESPSIHWYPNLLYKLADFFLPNHLVYS